MAIDYLATIKKAQDVADQYSSNMSSMGKEYSKLTLIVESGKVEGETLTAPQKKNFGSKKKAIETQIIAICKEYKIESVEESA